LDEALGSGVGLVVRPSSDVAERIALEVIQRVKEAGTAQRRHGLHGMSMRP